MIGQVFKVGKSADGIESEEVSIRVGGQSQITLTESESNDGSYRQLFRVKRARDDMPAGTLRIVHVEGAYDSVTLTVNDDQGSLICRVDY